MLPENPEDFFTINYTKKPDKRRAFLFLAINSTFLQNDGKTM